MIDFDNPPTDYRGTIEVYTEEVYQYAKGFRVTEWRWRCKSRNGQILASGEGYKRRAGALNAIDTQYAVRLATGTVLRPGDAQLDLFVPWRLVIHDRGGQVEKIGGLY
ncbi:YegP family protein [Gordonia sp. ABSL11-1]|uniref:YegP family protein n=1 Tax=Gordonia sp. ABSL11-1 TaxID=3053924 RepID=UPI0025744DF0|nr:YegP family protein [Gordonia sp. ABSL11-1]MDL9944204.1 YegP family protein [Gordonia sp. ABSL11-1]